MNWDNIGLCNTFARIGSIGAAAEAGSKDILVEFIECSPEHIYSLSKI